MENDLNIVVREFVLGKLALWKLPAISVHLMTEGYDSPTLRRLASETSPYSRDLSDMFVQAMKELKVRILTKEEVAKELAQEFAREIVGRKISPYEGACKIYKEIWNYLDNPKPKYLWKFVSNASTIEDCLTDHENFGTDHSALVKQCENEILSGANMLVSSDSVC